MDKIDVYPELHHVTGGGNVLEESTDKLVSVSPVTEDQTKSTKNNDSSTASPRFGRKRSTSDSSRSSLRKSIGGGMARRRSRPRASTAETPRVRRSFLAASGDSLRRSFSPRLARRRRHARAASVSSYEGDVLPPVLPPVTRWSSPIIPKQQQHRKPKDKTHARSKSSGRHSRLAKQSSYLGHPFWSNPAMGTLTAGRLSLQMGRYCLYSDAQEMEVATLTFMHPPDGLNNSMTSTNTFHMCAENVLGRVLRESVCTIGEAIQTLDTMVSEHPKDVYVRVIQKTVMKPLRRSQSCDNLFTLSDAAIRHSLERSASRKMLRLSSTTSDCDDSSVDARATLFHRQLSTQALNTMKKLRGSIGFVIDYSSASASGAPDNDEDDSSSVLYL